MIEALGGVTLMELRVGLGTATVAVPVTAPNAALIVAFPAAAPVARPLLLMVAIAVLEDDQVTELLIFPIVPSE